MELLWEEEPLTARQIREQLYDDSKTSQHGTVQRLLQSLEEKGFVDRDRSLGVHLFSATVSRETYGGLQLESLAENLTGGSIAPLLTHLLDEKKLDKTEIRRLRKLLEEAAHEVNQYANSLLNMAELLASSAIRPLVVASAINGSLRFAKKSSNKTVRKIATSENGKFECGSLAMRHHRNCRSRHCTNLLRSNERRVQMKVKTT